jgi:hypothetical protein
VNLAHAKPHSLTPIAPAALAATDRCAHAADKLTAVTPLPYPAAPTQSPPKFNNQKIDFSSIKVAPIDDGKAIRHNKKGEARTDVSLRRQAKSRSSQKIVHAIFTLVTPFLYKVASMLHDTLGGGLSPFKTRYKWSKMHKNRVNCFISAAAISCGG